MRVNPVKRTLAEGGLAIGTMVLEFSSSGIGRIAANAGADFIVYDMEHSGWGIETIRMLLATGRVADTLPLVRVPAAQYHLLSGPLDAGAMGLMIPMVETEDQARSIVRFARYPPQGVRGAAFGIAHDDYQTGDIVGTMRSANSELLLIAQIETAAGVEQVERIAAVEGIDVLWIGHMDLSTSLGIPGQFSHPHYVQAVDRVLVACHRHGKSPGIMAPDIATGRALVRQGFRTVAYSGDLWIYGEALGRGIDALKDQTGTAEDGIDTKQDLPSERPDHSQES
jgi:2-dehydro-3-deoxyglucarate aldolase/4-hydroxy-2-oxoheptanedioate aldolase